MAKKQTQAELATVKHRLEISCRYGPCQPLGKVEATCETWELPVYLMAHHFNHEGHKTEIRIDGIEYHRLPGDSAASPDPIVPATPTTDSATASPQTPVAGRFRFGAA